MRWSTIVLIATSMMLPCTATADVTLTVPSNGAFLRVDPTDQAGSPLVVTLADHGLLPGSLLRLTALGDFHNGVDGDFHTTMIAIFSSGPTILGPSLVDRVPGALDAGLVSTTGLTCPSGLPTNTPYDFAVRASSTDVTIPPGATHLLVQPNECYFVDNTDPDGDYAIQIAVLSTTGVASSQPGGVSLLAPWPNPGGARVTLPFTLAARSRASLTLHSVDGRHVRALLDGEMAPGRHEPVWDASDDRGARVPNGIYFARLVTPAGCVERKLVVAR